MITMKRILVVALLLTLFPATYLFANDWLGTYTSGKSKQSVEAYRDSADRLVLMIRVLDAPDCKQSTLVFTGDREINKLHEILSVCREKYSEWSIIAKKHDIKSYIKDIDIELPFFYLTWIKDEQELSGLAVGSATFSVMEGYPAVGIGGLAKSLSNFPEETTWLVSFFSDDEIASLMYWTDLSNLKRELEKKVQIDELFK